MPNLVRLLFETTVYKNKRLKLFFIYLPCTLAKSAQSLQFCGKMIKTANLPVAP